MRGMIVAPQPEAVEAGAVALKRGGNAVDAAIACALTQGAVDPQMCGIAGSGSMQIYLPKRGVHLFIDFHARSPAAVRPDMWQDLIIGQARDGFGFLLKDHVNEVGYQAIGIPGSLKAYCEALAEFGTMDLVDLLQPAIAYARDGFIVRPYVHYTWTMKESAWGRVNFDDRLRFTAPGRRIYFHPDGSLKGLGERIQNPDMARTLERIAQHGPDIFYRGEIAEEIAADMAAHGGLLSLDDLKAYRTVRAAPLWGSYRGHAIAANQPPGGGVQLLELLHIAENFDLVTLGHNSPDYIRILAEAMKRVTIDKDRHIGDPSFVDVPVERLLSRSYTHDLAERIRRGAKAHVERLGQPDPVAAESKNTTQVCVIDEDGNAVTMTHTLGAPSGVITEGLGFMYNGCMNVFDPRPGQTGSLAPGKSRFSSMAPSIVFRNETPFIVLGAPGGTFITLAIAQGIINVVDFGMSMFEAVAAPRFTATSDIIDVANRIPRFVTDAVAAQGYKIARSYQSYAFGGVHGIKITDGAWSGGADPQRDGMALEV
jgi:gamma-glutamyltranspeptidase / glutathione hydrolase